MDYHHLSHEERDQLSILRNQGKTLREIGAVLGRSASTLSREIRRNRYKPSWGKRLYAPNRAQKTAEHRLSQSHRSPRLKSAALHQAVSELLERSWSPELIAGRLRKTRRDLPTISPEAIYQWIYTRRRDLFRYLARAHPKRQRRWSVLKHRQRIPGRVSIRERPESINQRQESGHWETDLVVGPGSSALQVLVERKSRYSRLGKLSARTAVVSRGTLTRLMSPLPAGLRRSITYDNGSENAEHQVLNEDFGMQSYFCEPYHSWEKGTVENTNGLIRRFIPKKSRIEAIADENLQVLENWLNDRPRKVLEYRTPREAFQELVALAT